MSTTPADINALLDKQAIYEVIARYCRGIDRLDMALVRSAYHPDGIDHHTGFDGGRDEFIDWVEPLLRGLGGTMHTIGNHLAELHGEHAIAETYVTAAHWGESADGTRIDLTTGIRYVDHLERYQDDWVIRERFAVREWARSDPATLLPAAPTGPQGSRDRDDPIYMLNPGA